MAREYEKQLDLLMEKKKALEATPEELARASAPRLPPKRLREKVHDPDPEGQVAALKEANLKMQKELEALRKMSGSATPSPKPRPSPNTRTSTEKEPSGTKARNSRMCQKKDSKELTEEENEESQEEEEDEEEEEKETEENSQAGEQAEAEEDAEEGDDEEAEERTPEVTGKKPTGRKQPKTNSAPQSLGARKNRLRRMCELKPSGRLNVPEPIHEAWKNGSTAEREDMIATLDECGWRKEDFVKRVIKSREKVARKSAKKKRGWYSTEGMAKKLSWSGSYIKGVVKFCEKKGNEHLTKKDKYNKNITKYYVEYEEDDESADELEERERQEEIEATGVCQGTSTCQRFPYLFASWVLALCFFVRLASL
ncbi:unnamed protein product [Effrenium voratum]|uniref:Uncharacterized protein n=1 Tax=Effrenium voratum TaxID=2562239 RepID=A0AA36N3L5_9DINO|nr:unnamed protein product [Effrenium voratum]